MSVRSYHSADAATLAEVHCGQFPDDPVSPEQLRQRFGSALEMGGQVLVVTSGGRPVGYAVARPIPGLEALYDLQGCVAPAHESMGLGSRLLEKLLQDLSNRGGRQVSHAVEAIGSPVSRFLLNRGFFVEHVEWELSFDDMSQIPPVALPVGFCVDTSLDQEVAIRHFLRLYEASFVGLPWYQPYSSIAEVAAELEDPSDILFLLDRGDPVGFAWLRWSEPSVGAIEPLGIAPTHQGKGLARPLLSHGLHEMADQGARQIKIGAWRDNSVAIRLYQSVGFRHRANLSYLAFDLKRESQMS